MNYPTINKKEITKAQKLYFRQIKKVILEQLTFDNRENELGLSKKDITLLAWNAATRLL